MREDYQERGKKMIVSSIYAMWGTEQAMRHARVLRYWMRKKHRVTSRGIGALEATITRMATDYSNLYLR